jgi:26S proteasome regulatory subunit N6
MTNNQDDVNGLLASKHGLNHAGRVYTHIIYIILQKDLEAMRAINLSYKNKSLIQFNNVLSEYKNEVLGDQILKLHIEALYQALLERNLFNVIKPYSRVQIKYIAERMQLEQMIIQNK